MKFFSIFAISALLLLAGCISEVPKDNLPKACTLEYAPVCGEDGTTYGNKCMADADDAVIDYVGECKPKFTPEQVAQKIAEDWLKTSPTYSYDGIEGSIEFQDSTLISTCKDCYQFTYKFQSSHMGYGNREGKVLVQTIADHEILIQTNGNNVSYAITDGTYDELRNITICMALSAIVEVCGEDGKTYSHPCFANEAMVKIAHEGECVEPKIEKQELTKESCEQAGGSWNDYSKACNCGPRNQASALNCPKGYYCKGAYEVYNPSSYGICEPE